MTIKDALLGIRPLLGKELEALTQIEELLDEKDAQEIEKLRKQLKITFYHDTLGISLLKESAFPQLRAKSAATAANCKEINEKIRKAAKINYFKEFAHNVFSCLKDIIGTGTPNAEALKEAVVLQLFSKLHILVLADVSSGASAIARNTAQLAPIASSGNSGLAVMPKGKSVVPGLLPQANNGLCVIDGLKLVRNEAKALIAAMDKGLVTYDKAGEHLKFDAKASIFATATPLGDRFIGSDIRGLRKQIPFDKQLLSRFHLVFTLRKPGVEGFGPAKQSKPEKVSEADASFIKDYIANARLLDVKFPSALQEDVVEFVKKLKEQDRNYIIPVSPAIASAFVELAKASARMELRQIVSDVDLVRVKNIIRHSTEFI